ncbi:MAG: hypothetical protein DYG89_04590 [Caldilinea sp. CFX5]|nr:hypothetical protein [Caldilinea sp. CFX5]
MNTLSREQIVNELYRLGLGAGQIVFVHSSLSSLGHVQGGAATVVDAFLAVLGVTGTLVVPTFTFAHGRAEEPIFDPYHDRSEMGAITEAVRTRPGARRSCHLLHGVARYRQDPLLFVKTAPDYHPISGGVVTGELYKEKVVVVPEQVCHL